MSRTPGRLLTGLLVAALATLIVLAWAAPTSVAHPGPAHAYAPVRRAVTAARISHARRVPTPRLAVTGASLIDASTGRVLWGVNPNRQLAIASTTKLMTALITLQHVHHLGTVYTQNNYRPAPDDSQIGLRPGEKMNVHDLLVAMMLPSADDAAEDLAYNVGHHSVARFLAMMNAEARALHLSHTHYTTPIGLDTPGNYSSPTDLDRLAAYDRDHSPFFRRLVDLTGATIHAGGAALHVVNRNDLVGRYWWINGVKTGFTNHAGNVLVVSGTRWGMTLIGSVLGTSSQAARDANALALISYGFAAYHLNRAIRPNHVLARLPEQGSSQRAPVIAKWPFSRVLKKTTRVHVRLHLPRRLTGPMARHSVVGVAVVYAGHNALGRVPLILARAVPAVSPVTASVWLTTEPSTLLLLALLVVALAVYTTARRHRGRPQRTPADEGPQ